MSYEQITVPDDGEIITISDGILNVPDRPIIPFIEGDGTGPDIWRASVRVFDAAVLKAYGQERQIEWMEVYAGGKAFDKFGEWLPEETVKAFREFLVGIKGPLTTPVGGGIRSLNVALRKMLDLYVCLRPVRYVSGVPSPVKRPEDVLSSGRTRRIFTLVWNLSMGRKRISVSRTYYKRLFPRSSRNSGSRKVRGLDSSRFRWKAPNASFEQPSVGHWRMAENL
jgi:hypothetical protein